MRPALAPCQQGRGTVMPTRERLLGRTRPTGLVECLEGEPVRTCRRPLPELALNIRRSSFRQGGRPLNCSFGDLSQALRRKSDCLAEVVARARARIEQLLARSSQSRQSRQAARTGAFAGGLARGCASGHAGLSGRAEALSRFMESYSRLAACRSQEGSCHLGATSTGGRLGDAARRHRQPAPSWSAADSDQLEQLLINLVRNAATRPRGQRGVSSGGKAGRSGGVYRGRRPGLSNTQPVRALLHHKPGGSASASNQPTNR